MSDPRPSIDFKAFVAAFQAEMQKLGVTIAMLDRPECVHYFTGYSVSEGCQQFCIIPQKGDPYMVLRTADKGGCELHSWLPLQNIRTFNDWQDPIQYAYSMCIAEGLITKGESTLIGIDENSCALNPARHRQLAEIFAGSTFVDFGKFLVEIQSVKSPEEIALIRNAGQIASNAIDHIAQLARVGTTTRWLTAQLFEFIIRNGGDAGIAGVVTRAPSDTNMHPTAGDKNVEEGDLLFVEAIVQISGYTARTMRNILCGKLQASQRSIVGNIIRFQDAQFSAMRPGAKASEVDAVLRKAMLDAGLKDLYPNITGYQLGYYQLFTGRSSDFSRKFDPEADWTLRAGMVSHMYVVAQGFAFSETILVTEEGYERLTLGERKVYSSSK